MKPFDDHAFSGETIYGSNTFSLACYFFGFLESESSLYSALVFFFSPKSFSGMAPMRDSFVVV